MAPIASPFRSIRSPFSTTKPVTPLVPSAVEFGALTRAGAGGAPAPVGATSITGGTATGYSLTGGYVVPTADGSATSGTVTFNNATQLTMTAVADTLSVRTDAERAAAITFCAASPTLDRTIMFRPGNYTGFSITNTLMSGTESGVPVVNFVESERGGVWDPTYTGGSIRFKSEVPKAAKVLGTVQVSGASRSSGLIFDGLTIGNLAASPQWFYEPDDARTVIALTPGNPTVIGIDPNINAGVRFTTVGTKVRMNDLPGDWFAMTPNPEDFVIVLAVDEVNDTVTVDFDSTGFGAYTGGATFFGSTRTDEFYGLDVRSNSDVIFRECSLGSRAFNEDPAYWVNVLQNQFYGRLVFYRCDLDGFGNGLMLGAGREALVYGCTTRNNFRDVLPIRGYTVTSTRSEAPTRSITNITQANPCVMTVPGHGLQIGDAFIAEGVVGMTQINWGGGTAYALVVNRVIDGDNIEVATYNTSGLEVTTPLDSTGFTAYGGGGTLTGPLAAKVWIENTVALPPTSAAIYPAPHSDVIQLNSPNNRVNLLLHVYDLVGYNVALPNASKASQGFWSRGNEFDATIMFGNISNVLLASSSPAVFNGPGSRDFRFAISYITAVTEPGADGAQFNSYFNMPPRVTLVNSILGAPLAGFEAGQHYITNSRFGIIPSTSRVGLFEGNFTTAGRDDGLTVYRLDLIPTGDTAEDLIAQFAAAYKSVGADANRGFGADPDGIYFTGTNDNAVPVLNAVTWTPNVVSATLDWSATVGKGWAYALLDNTAGLTAQQVIDRTKAAIGAQGKIIGVTATGAQPQLSWPGLTPSTGYRGYLVQVNSQGAVSAVSELTFTTNALVGPQIEQSANVLSSTSNVNSWTSGNFTVGSATNRVLVAMVELVASTPSADTSGTECSFGGVAMTRIGMQNGAGGSGLYTRLAAFVLPAPATGTATVTVLSKDAGGSAINIGGCAVRLFELSNADQTTGDYATFGVSQAGSTGLTTSGSVANNNSLLLSALAITSGDFSGQIAATGGATLVGTGSTGTNAFSDMTYATSFEVVAASGANGNGFTWTTAANACALTLVVPQP